MTADNAGNGPAPGRISEPRTSGSGNQSFRVEQSGEGAAHAGGADPTARGDGDAAPLLTKLPGADSFTVTTRAAVYAVAFSPQGDRLITGNADGMVESRDTTDRNTVAAHHKHAGTVLTVACSPDGRYIASGGVDKTVKLRDTAKRGQPIVLKGHTESVQCVAFSPCSTCLASGSRDKTVRLWRTAKKEEIAVLKGHKGFVRSVAFSPDGRYLATGSTDCSIRLWHVETGERISVLTGHNGSVYSVAFSPDGRYLASGSCDKTIRLWHAANGEHRRTIRGHDGWVECVAFSPDGKFLASGSRDATARLWDATTGREAASLEGHAGPVRSVAFSPSGEHLATGSRDTSVRFWDLAANIELRQWLGYRDLDYRCVRYKLEHSALVAAVQKRIGRKVLVLIQKEADWNEEVFRFLSELTHDLMLGLNYAFRGRNFHGLVFQHFDGIPLSKLESVQLTPTGSADVMYELSRLVLHMADTCGHVPIFHGEGMLLNIKGHIRVMHMACADASLPQEKQLALSMAALREIFATLRRHTHVPTSTTARAGGIAKIIKAISPGVEAYRRLEIGLEGQGETAAYAGPAELVKDLDSIALMAARHWSYDVLRGRLSEDDIDLRLSHPTVRRSLLAWSGLAVAFLLSVVIGNRWPSGGPERPTPASAPARAVDTAAVPGAAGGAENGAIPSPEETRNTAEGRQPAATNGPEQAQDSNTVSGQTTDGDAGRRHSAAPKEQPESPAGGARETAVRPAPDPVMSPDAYSAWAITQLEGGRSLGDHEHVYLCRAMEKRGGLGELSSVYRNLQRSMDPALREYLAVRTAGPEEPEKKIIRYRQFVKKHPAFPWGHYSLAGILGASGKYGEAVEEYREARRLKPESRLIRRGLAFALLAVCRARRDTQTLGQAAVLFAALHEEFPDIAEYSFGLIMCRIEANEPRAREKLELLVERHPGYEPARKALAELNADRE